jgi:hypothetical protein
MDVKTLLLLGIGMAVLSLVGFCSARSRAAELVRRQVPSLIETLPQPDPARQPRQVRLLNDMSGTDCGRFASA